MAYENCKWCKGRGCLACSGEKEKADKQLAERRLNKEPLSETGARLLMAVSQQTGVKIEPTIQVRYENGIYRDCPKCGGVGCVSCPAECDAEYARQFPNGPQPIATFDVSTPEGVEGVRGCMADLFKAS
jgi:hypothetical protein